MSIAVTHGGPVAAPPPPEPAPAEPNYLNTNYGIWSWLTTVDHKRIGILYLISISVFFVAGGVAAGLVRLNLLAPDGAILSEDAYNRAFTGHGVLMLFFFLIPAVPGGAGELLHPAHDRGEGPGVPETEPRKLVRVHDRRRFRYLGHPRGRHRHRLDAVSTVQFAGIAIERGARRIWRVHIRVQLDHDRAEHHGDGAQDALPRYDVGPAAAVRVVALRHEPDSASRHARHRHHDAASHGRARCRYRHLRSEHRWRPAPVPAPVLVLLAPGRVHHDLARHGRGQRGDHMLQPQEHLWLQGRGVVKRRHRGGRVHGLGAPHVRGRDQLLLGAALQLPEYVGRGTIGHQGV